MWQKAPPHFNLSEQEIHVWRAKLDINSALQNDYWPLLSADEKARANRFRFPYLKTYFVAARGILRQLLGQYLGQPPANISFIYGAQGKPALADFPNFYFNISHTKNIALFAFSKQKEMGVDIEYIDPNIACKTIAPRFFSKREAATLLALPPAEQSLVFFNCWTRKEAFIKAKGGGLSIPLDQFEVTLLVEEMPKLLAINWAMEEVSDWSLYSFLPNSNMVGALAVKDFSGEIAYFDWDKGV